MKSGDYMKKYMLLIIISGIVLFYFSIFNYPLFHATIEIFTVVVGLLIFTVSIISKKFNENTFLINLGPGIFVVALITYLHLITYKGINLIYGYTANLPTQFWIILNYILVASILIALIYNNKKINYYFVLIIYTLVGFILCLLCFFNIFPDCFIDGVGLTKFKKISEYIIIIIYLINIYILNKKSIIVEKKALNIILILLIIAEYMFTLYINVYGLQNFLGHYIRLIAFILIYKSIVLEGIQKPYNSIFVKLNNLTITDGLTNLYNHSYFMEVLEEKKDLSQLEKKSLFLGILDIDNFKTINDTYGHLEGDRVLKEVSSILCSNIRASNGLAFRYGGDEFSLVLYDIDEYNVTEILNNIKEVIIERFSEKNINITLSGGVAKYSEGSTETLIKKADQLLYKAKNDGRNRIYFDF